ncbi:hypothetical protein LPW36_04775 [Jinshanibacter sp. LJY008]|uniref:Uncharacterized protein n=1 Tax=Limnobaculum eriocheiris TaxID=2897391 RepID=A0A9X1SKI4_9GAMM|nr:hypothetical protein [Limnobaculum eriocheiris]MCD1125344.1 hypothetical protein [Limnobaculum eriocheiris]
MKNSTLSITEVAVLADELQSLLGVLYVHDDTEPDLKNCIGIAWNIGCRVATWLEEEGAKGE